MFVEKGMTFLGAVGNVRVVAYIPEKQEDGGWRMEDSRSSFFYENDLDAVIICLVDEGDNWVSFHNANRFLAFAEGDNDIRRKLKNATIWRGREPGKFEPTEFVFGNINSSKLLAALPSAAAFVKLFGGKNLGVET